MKSDKAPIVQAGITAAGLIALYKAILILLRVNGWWIVDEEHYNAWLGVGEALFPILVTVVSMWWVSRKTTALNLPTDKDGVRLIRADTKEPAIEETRSIEKAVLGKVKRRP